MSISITSTTTVTGATPSTAVAFAVEDIERDLKNTIAPSDAKGADIVLVDEPHGPEAYEVRVSGGNLEIHAGDDRLHLRPVRGEPRGAGRQGLLVL